MITIFDTHTHLNADDFVGREDEELALAKEMGVTRHNVVGFDAPTIKRALDLAEKYPEVYATIGWHPTEAGSYNQEVDDMIEIFKRQIQLSKDHDLPFIVHTRDALEDTYQVIKEAGVGPRGGIIHSFSGSLEMAERFIELGMMISFSGVVTFKKALDVQEAAQKLPLDKILVETDAPYLAPVPKRGRENRTAYTRYVVDKIAELRGLSVEEVAQATTENAKRLFDCD